MDRQEEMLIHFRSCSPTEYKEHAVARKSQPNLPGLEEERLSVVEK